MAEEKMITKDQHDIALLRQELKAHQVYCVERGEKDEKHFSELFRRVNKLERIIYLGLGGLAVLQFVIAIAPRFLF